ncbi:MAG: M1 family metallopeptidase [Clostridiales bacterium]|nr:M1 family metallopeptidase [Clostridiales bacterium]
MKKIILLLCVLSVFPFFTSCKNEEVFTPCYSLGVTLNEDMTIDGQMTYSFSNEYQKNLSKIEFNLYPNAYRENASVKPVFDSDISACYENGFSEGKIDILAVKNSGKDAVFEVSGENMQTLKVWLNDCLDLGEKTEVYIKFKVTLPNANHRLGYGENTVNLSWFYPIASVYENGEFYSNVYYPAGDPFYSECADYKVKLNVPSSFVVASSLPFDKTEWIGGNTEYVLSGNSVRDVAFFLSKKYNVIKKSAGKTQVTYYYYNDLNPEKTLDTACKSLNFFSSLYGEYPYSEYSVCQGDFIYGGMEYSGLSLIADNANSFTDYVVAHETAHQWFHGIVGFNESEIGFLDEGLAEFSTAYFMGKYKLENREYIDYINDAKNSYLSIKSSIDKVYGEKPPIMKRNLKQFRTNAEYVMISYNRSEVMIDSLYNYLGEKKFFKTVKKFVKEKAFKNANEEDFISAVEKKKRGAGNLLRSFIRGEREISL